MNVFGAYLRADAGGCIVPLSARRGVPVRRIASERLSPHRIVYELAYGPLPAGATVRRSCGNAYCCRLDHLELAGQRSRDRLAQLDDPPTACGRGHLYDAEIPHVDARGRLTCRVCLRERQRARRARIAEEAVCVA